MEMNNIRIYRDAYEELIKLKEEKYPEMGAMNFYTEIIKKGIAADRINNDGSIAANQDKVEKKEKEEKDLKPEWVKGLLLEDIKKYCHEHKGAKEEYLKWWARTHTPEQVESMDLTLSMKRW
ncbi:MAG: hypothetical protein K6F00_02305 [Lachnospiraceae bacterium]|nr:hypothetical protein [Lachnospiraceae bacterium]